MDINEKFRIKFYNKITNFLEIFKLLTIGIIDS